jgi:hypothetical protein
MKTFLLVLFLSLSALSQTKNNERYKIVECQPINNTSTILLIDGETGKTWTLKPDTLISVSGKGVNGIFQGMTYVWEPIPVKKVWESFHDPRIFTIQP